MVLLQFSWTVFDKSLLQSWLYGIQNHQRSFFYQFNVLFTDNNWSPKRVRFSGIFVIFISPNTKNQGMPDKPNGNKVTIKSSLNNGLCSTLFHKDNSFSFIYESSDLSIEDVGYEGNTIVLYAKGSKRSAVCPYCGGESHHVHSRYTRTINDLSILGKKVVLILESRKFFCKMQIAPQRHLPNNPAMKSSATAGVHAD